MIFNFNLQDYVIEIYEGNQCIQQQRVSLPPPMAQAQFLNLCREIKSTGHPMKCKIIKYEWVDGRDAPIELYIEFQTWED